MQFDILIAEKLLKKAKTKAAQAEVAFSQGRSREVHFEEGQLKNIEVHHLSGIGLRIIHQGKIGVAATNRLDAADRLVQEALTVSEFGPEAFFEFPGAQIYPDPKTYDSSLWGLSDRALILRGQAVVDEFKSFNADILTNLGFVVSENRSVLLNSAGLRAASQGSKLSFSAWWDLVKEGDMLQVGEGQSSRRNDIFYDFYLNRAKDKLQKAQKIASIKSGRYAVVFTPSSVLGLLEYVFLALNGKTVLKGSSRLAQKLGQVVFDKKLSIYDDGTLDWKIASSQCDDEGVAARPLTLIAAGVPQNFYYDLQTAAKAKTKSTGHASRGKGAALPSPSLNNVLVDQGKRTYNEMIQGIKQGILAEEFLGAGQNNPYNGDFSLNLNLGYKIENGEIVGRVKNTMIAGNVFDLLKNNLISLSSEREWVGNSFLSPYFLIDGVSVAAG